MEATASGAWFHRRVPSRHPRSADAVSQAHSDVADSDPRRLLQLSDADALLLSQLEEDLVRELGPLDRSIADFSVFGRLFDQHFDRMVQTRRARNLELFQTLVAPTPGESGIRDALAVTIFDRLRQSRGN
jgi:hypothetical protein